MNTDCKYNYIQSGMSNYYKQIKQSPNSSWYTTRSYPEPQIAFKVVDSYQNLYIYSYTLWLYKWLPF